MRIGIRPSSAVDRLVLALGLVPVPILDTQLAYTMGRVIMAGADLGIFDALEHDSAAAEQIAERLSLDPSATRALMDALVGCDYLSYSERAAHYALRPVARRWLLSSSERSLVDKMRLQRLEWEVMGKLEDFVRSGEHIDWHGDRLTEQQWGDYQRGMTDIGRLILPEVVKRTRLPKHAETMLDIGGAGGTYSAGFVRAHPGLSATVLDLPAAVDHARPLIEAHGLGDRLRIEAGNVLEADLGEAKYDFVFMANVAHHLSAEQNIAVAGKVHRALRDGGVYCILDVERLGAPSPRNQSSALMNLFFAMTSQVGTWAVSEMQGWLTGAGFVPGRPVRMRTGPAIVEVWGTR